MSTMTATEWKNKKEIIKGIEKDFNISINQRSVSYEDLQKIIIKQVENSDISIASQEVATHTILAGLSNKSYLTDISLALSVVALVLNLIGGVIAFILAFITIIAAFATIVNSKCICKEIRYYTFKLKCIETMKKTKQI